MMFTVEQFQRLEQINQLMKLIGDLDLEATDGRSSFFFSKETRHGTKNHYGYFLIDYQHSKSKQQLFYIDNYTEAKVKLQKNKEPKGFSCGGTILGLVSDFQEWILNGNYFDGTNGYGGLYCAHWGGKWTIERKDKVIQKAKEIGYLKSDDLTFADYCKYAVEKGSSIIKQYYGEELGIV